MRLATSKCKLKYIQTNLLIYNFKNQNKKNKKKKKENRKKTFIIILIIIIINRSKEISNFNLISFVLNIKYIDR